MALAISLNQKLDFLVQVTPPEVQNSISELRALVLRGREAIPEILAKLSVMMILVERNLPPMVKAMLPPNLFPLMRNLSVKMGEIAAGLPANPTSEQLFRPILEIVQNVIPIYEEVLPMSLGQLPPQSGMIVRMGLDQVKGTIGGLLDQLPLNPNKVDINTAVVNMIVEKLQTIESVVPMITQQFAPMLETEDRELVTKLLPELIKNFRVGLQEQLKASPAFELGTITRLALQSAALPLLHRVPQELLQIAEVISDAPITVMREQVPFERWSFDYKTKTDDSLEIWKQRGWAVLHLCEAGVKTTVEAVAWAIAKIAELFSVKFEHGSGDRAEVLGVIARSLVNSAIAIWSPDAAREIKDVGCSGSNWKWGTGYVGERTSYFEFESSSYNWKKA